MEVEHLVQFQRKGNNRSHLSAANLRKIDASKIFEKKSKNYQIGQDVPLPSKELSRYVKWPKYIKTQRKKRILYHRLKVPPTINQFTKAADKNHATSIFKLLDKYRPEAPEDKEKRLKDLALKKAEHKVASKKAKAEGKPAPAALAKPVRKAHSVRYGINVVTGLVEKQKAQLVIIAHDVDPIELVVWLPALCRKMGVPYVIVKCKARLGAVIHHKTCTALAIQSVEKEDTGLLQTLVSYAKEHFNEKYDENRKSWGGLELGPKAQAREDKKAKLAAKLAAQQLAK